MLLNLETSSNRRQSLSLKFAKNCIKHEKERELFHLNNNSKTSVREPYEEKHAKTSRMRDSTIPQLQRSLNFDARKIKY